ncbi:unnamed protein product [Brassica oleracea]|uniref:Uncharacterized protein n=1 Tax=Brassica oleracea TaxID=3712 RepID=A0A3P6B1X2_BRAOL|nr:unnamed protein product [Brassica oleracea]
MLLWRSETYTPDQDRAREVSDQREEAEERRRPL